MKSEREQFLDHRIPILRKMLDALEAERRDLERERIRHFYDRLEDCNPSRELTP